MTSQSPIIREFLGFLSSLNLTLCQWTKMSEYRGTYVPCGQSTDQLLAEFLTTHRDEECPTSPPSLTEEELASLERVRSDSDRKDLVPARPPEHIHDDAQTLVYAMQRLFPVDDGEPITREWVLTFCTPVDHVVLDWRYMLNARSDVTIDHIRDAWVLRQNRRWLIDVATRGDVRAFLRGMRINTKQK